MHAIDRTRRSGADGGAHRNEAVQQPPDQSVAALRRAEGRRDGPDVPPDVTERHRLQRHDARARADDLAHRRLDVLQADGADFALRLGDDHGRGEAIQYLRVDPVDRQPVGDYRTHLTVDAPADLPNPHLRRRADRKAGDGGRVVALVGTAHEPRLEAERADDLRGARDQGDDPVGHPRLTVADALQRRQSRQCGAPRRAMMTLGRPERA